MEVAIILVSCVVLAAYFVLILKSPKYVFFGVFLVRPLIEFLRVSIDSETARLIINGIGIVIPTSLLLVMLFQNQLFSKFNMLVLAFMLVVLASSFINEISSNSAEIAIRIISPFVMLIFPQTVIKSEDDLKKFFRIIAISSVFVLLAVLLDWDRTNINYLRGWVQDAVVTSGGGLRPRLAAVFGVPTATAFWLFQFFAVTFFLFEVESRLYRWAYLALCALMLIPMYFTFSRAAWIACFVLVLSYYLFEARYRIALVIGATVLVFSVFLLPDVLLRIQSISTVQTRITSWTGYLGSVFSQGFAPMIVGLGWIDLPAKNVLSGDLFSPGSTGIVENSYLYLLVGAGVIAFVLFWMIFVSLGHKAWTIKGKTERVVWRKLAAWGLGLIGAWFIMGMSGDVISYVVINWYFYALFGCIIAVSTNRAGMGKSNGNAFGYKVNAR